MSEENEPNIRGLVDEFVSQGNTNIFDELVSPDVVENEDLGKFPPNAEGVNQFFAMVRSAFRNLGGTIYDMIAKGDGALPTGESLWESHRVANR